MRRKRVVLVLILAIFLLQIANAELEISKEPVIDAVIPEINRSGIYDLKIKNLGPEDSFQVYSLVGVDIYPNETFSIGSGQTKKVEV